MTAEQQINKLVTEQQALASGKLTQKEYEQILATRGVSSAERKGVIEKI